MTHSPYINPFQYPHQQYKRVPNARPLYAFFFFRVHRNPEIPPNPVRNQREMQTSSHQSHLQAAPTVLAHTLHLPFLLQQYDLFKKQCQMGLLLHAN
ncbi:hypothetical protein H5410_022788 [Solanum commersonii]|uniref:Uncharacterized protein n=1 Tax=Solanum commersonii TaxID=4109 RepID=A0A9J5ZF12_SOLCO|nr:hypothetical protein H5410_022788 [Solanum commersonii]